MGAGEGMSFFHFTCDISYWLLNILHTADTKKQFFSYFISAYRVKVERVTIKTLEFAYFEKAGVAFSYPR